MGVRLTNPALSTPRTEHFQATCGKMPDPTMGAGLVPHVPPKHPQTVVEGVAQLLLNLFVVMARATSCLEVALNNLHPP